MSNLRETTVSGRKLKIGQVWQEVGKDGKLKKKYVIHQIGIYAAGIVPVNASSTQVKRAWLRHFDEGKFVFVSEATEQA